MDGFIQVAGVGCLVEGVRVPFFLELEGKKCPAEEAVFKLASEVFLSEEGP